MMEFLLKVSFIVGVALLFYKLFLQQESFFGSNRIYFIFCIILAFGLPYVQIPQLIRHQGFVASVFQFVPPGEMVAEGSDLKYSEKSSSIESHTKAALNRSNSRELDNPQTSIFVSENSGSTGEFSWVYFLIGLYLFGLVIFTLNLLFQIGNICISVFKSPDKIQHGNCVVVNTAHKQAPCSFFKYIFIHPQDYDLETYEQIIAHEKIHVRQGHTWDLLFAELAVAVLWFNPLIWWYKKEIEKNIEFETDAILLQEERVTKENYQMNLLQIAAPHKPLTITTNYNQSLLKQRIMMMNAKKSTLNRYWKYTFMVPLFFGTILLLNKPAVSQGVAVAVSEPAAVNVPVTISAPVVLPQPEVNLSLELNSVPQVSIRNGEDMTQGFFYSYQTATEYCIDFKGKSNDGSWSMNECFDKSLFQKQDDKIFAMIRETGTLTLIGNLDEEASQGKYEFVKNAEFENFLSQNNIKTADPNYIFHLHLHQVDRQYVNFVKKQFEQISSDQLLAFAIHDIDQQYIESLVQSGFNNPDANQVIAARIHHVNPEVIQEIKALGFEGLELDKIIELQIHDINAAFIEDLKNAGFKNLSLEEIVSAKIHDLDPAAIKGIEALGFENMDFDDLLSLQIHEVDKRFIEELKGAGFSELSLNQIIQAKIHGLNPTSVKEMQALGFKNLSFEKLLQAKIHDVNAAYLSDLKSAGFSGFSVDKAIEAKIHGVDSNFIKEAKSKGYNLKTLDEYIRVKMHGLARNGDNE